MRKCIFLLSIAFLLCGCSKSIDEKAKDLVTDNLTESVTNKESLQIISISVDSCFYDIVAVDKALQEYQKIQNEYDDLDFKDQLAQGKANSARENAKNMFGLVMYQNAANQLFEARAAKNEYMVSVVQPKEQEVLALLRPKDQKEFKCYKVSVKYKSEATKGKLKEHTNTYYVKADATEVIKILDLEDVSSKHYKTNLIVESGNIPEML